MELKEGMYVRTKDGFIDKVINDYKDSCNNPNCNCKHVSCEHNYYYEENIIKASYNLIDLIEQDDLLEIRYLIKSNEYQKEIVQVIKNYAGKLYVNTFPKKIFVEDFDRYGIEILSIVTKEMFDSVKYEVE